jgi:transposase InsO family protein
MIKQKDKELILAVIKKAVKSGARKTRVCKILDIPIRNIQRWEKSTQDKRIFNNSMPKNKLSEEERKSVIDFCCEARFVDKTPKEIVPILAEQGIYVASESTIYRILREERMLNHREESRKPKKRHKVKELKATGPNQVWSWDITYLKTNINGHFFFLYLFIDIWSRKIVAFDVFEEQTSLNARTTLMSVENIFDLENVQLHSDNGSPMKGATFLATLQ